MTDAELRALVAKATPGPRKVQGKMVSPAIIRSVVNNPASSGGSGVTIAIWLHRAADALEIVTKERDAAVNALPALLDRLAAAERDAERYRWLERFDHLTQVNSMLESAEYTTLNAAVDTARDWELARSDAAREGK